MPTAWLAPRHAATADCPYANALGTSRTLPVSVTDTPRIGLKEFPNTLTLADKEVVLTFDDGPFPPTTRHVLAALADQCVRATFFLIGENAARNPDLVRKIAADGHSIGSHTWSHPIVSRLSEAAAEANIDKGIAAIDDILGKPRAGDDKSTRPARFFRFPGFVSTPKLLQFVNDRGAVVFGTDLWASDWNSMSPDQELHQIEGRLKTAHKGIILFHDIKAQTAAMLPAFLRFLKEGGYHVVHVVPEGGAPPALAAPARPAD